MQRFYGGRGGLPDTAFPPEPAFSPEPAFPSKPEIPPEDVLPENRAADPPPEPPRSRAGGLPEDLSPQALAVANAVADGPLYVDELIAALGLSAAQAQIAVTELELEDVVAVLPGGRVALK